MSFLGKLKKQMKIKIESLLYGFACLAKNNKPLNKITSKTLMLFSVVPYLLLFNLILFIQPRREWCNFKSNSWISFAMRFYN